MKPYQAQCLEVARKGYTSSRWSKKKNKRILSQVEPTLCQEMIWFEPSLQPGIMVGKCPMVTHNPVYRKVASTPHP